MINFNLEKSTEVLQFSLAKHNVGTINPCQVHMVMDVSGSFRDEHRDGYTQQLLNRFVPFSMLFDKDQILDSYAFGSKARHLEDITANNYSDYISKEMPIGGVNGCTTNYADAFRLMVGSCQPAQSPVEAPTGGFLSRLFSKKAPVEVLPEPEKHLFFFVTDGDPDNEAEARSVLKDLIQDNIFIVFISINSESVRFLKGFAQQSYSMYVNYTPHQLRNLVNVTDEDLYSQLLSAPQLVEWMNK